MTIQEAPRPPVLWWQQAYCGAMTLLYVAVVVGVLALFWAEWADAEMSAAELLVFGGMVLALGLALAGAFAASFFLPRRPWVWVYHLVLIAIGMTSACCLPVTVPLLVFWIRPEVKAYFGRAIAT
jgi:hypothetical protein